MKELERIEELVRIHKKKKRKRIMTVSAIIVPLFIIVIVAIYILRPDSPAAATTNAAVSPEDMTDSPVSSESQEPQTAAPTNAELTVSLMGDCTLGMDQSFHYETSLNAYYDYRGADYFFENVKDILAADDLSIVNMEGTLTESETRQEKQFAFKGRPEFADILTAGSIEAANLANNHSRDYGEESYIDTAETLDEAGITTFGYDETAITEINGIKVGLVGIYELADHLERTAQLEANIAKVKANGADLVIVSFHWGNESETIPDYHQMTLGHAAIDLGADLVVGHHAHVLQGIEKYRDKYIAYGLGNFCFGGNSSPTDKDTMIFQQTFAFENGQLVLDDNTNIIPCLITSEPGLNNYQPTPASGEDAERILQKIEERSAQIFSQRL